jgi:hypothetical protein
LADRLQAARERLQAALLSGDDATPYRTAIAALQAVQRADETRRQEMADEQAAERGRWIASRARQIVETSAGTVETMLSRFPIPATYRSST